MELLATSGNTIKLWDTGTYSLHQEIPSENGRVSGLTWNQDGQCIASLGETGEEIYLLAIKGKSAANIGVVRGIEAPSCIRFANRVPHYLGVGTRSGTITIWNVKSQAQKKTVTVADGAMTHICFSHNDSHITAATKKGSLYSLSVLNNVTTGPFKIFENQGVTGLMYNRVKKSLVGCCSEVGGVAMFDTHAGKLVHAIPQAHAAPAAAIAFSPVNEYLMVSVGYDKKFACYNVQTKDTLMTHRSQDPLTSVAFLAGGQRVALGTMTGKVFVHDLRHIRPPLATLSAHTSDITNILLQPLSRSKSESGMSVGKRAGQISTTATSLGVEQQDRSKSWSDQTSEGKFEAKKITDDVCNVKTSTGSQESSPSVFSPIRNTTKGSPIGCEARIFTEPIDPCDIFSPVRQTDALAPRIPPEMSDVFSPIRQNGSQDIPVPPEMSDIFSPIRQTGSPTTNTTSPLMQMMWSHNEGDVNSSVKKTKNTSVSPGHNNTNCHTPKVHIGVSDFSVNIKDKENIEPVPGQAESKMEAQLSSHTPSIMSTTPCGKLIEEQCESDIVYPLCDTGNVIDKIEDNNTEGYPRNVPPDSDDTTLGCTPKKNSERKLVPSLEMDTTSSQVLLAHRDVSSPGNRLKMTKGGTPMTNVGKGTPNVGVTVSPSATTVVPRHFVRHAPPRKKQFLRPVQGSDLLPEVPGLVMQSEENQSESPGSLMGRGSVGGAAQLQIELVRNCVAEVVEEFHDDINRRLLHLQYIMTKHFLEQQEVMERLHRQYSLNEDLLRENERLRQEMSHLQSKY
ncbi:hypothetical protein Pcinc_005345 [Petrolisthes cinctipes]|uniref:Neural cell expressed, developmentally down-regulated 1 n=1 Tax=Petrolisthes cinctipes TaxID=88211 RepID=A0AAE1L2T0_PETCI|nr:hypothetical protein Pcinc_005345 [Petrolisthes cinctipes]